MIADITSAIEIEGGKADPRELIEFLCITHQRPDVIEGLQCALEQERIALDWEGMVIARV